MKKECLECGKEYRAFDDICIDCKAKEIERRYT